MKRWMYGVLAASMVLAGCETPGGGKSGSASSALSSINLGGGGTGASSTENKMGAALDVFKAATVSDDELKTASLQFRAYEDKRQRLAPAGNKYAQRLARLTAKHGNEDGMKLNYKVYLSNTVNADATPDGSIRFYSALMDMLTDAELLGVIGHEIGHVKHGHSLSAMRTAYLASAGRKAAASNSGVAGALADSDLGALGEKLINSQFSQKQEHEADDYGQAFLIKHKYNPKGLETALRKLDAMSGKKGGALEQMLSTHPEPGARADRLRDKLAAK